MAPEYSIAAQRDLTNVWLYLAERGGVQAADELVERIGTTIGRVLAKHPRAGRVRPEFGNEVRSFPVVPYVVFYRWKRGRTQVLRIVHGHRDLQAPLSSLLIAV